MNTDGLQGLPRSSPGNEGVASSSILRFVEACERQMCEMHSFMLLRHGHVIAEGWWSPYRPEYPHLMFSVSKSFTSTAIGFAVAAGRLSIDDPVLSFFPDEQPDEVSDNLAAMTVRHLLTMTTGHVVDTWPFQVESLDGNWIKAFLNVPVAQSPGTYFLYNTGASYMLAAIIQKLSGMKLIDYLKPRLFDPLGIQDATWQESPQGVAVGGYGLSIKTEDLAKFGQLYLQKGKWADRQLIPEAWVEAATSTQVASGDPDVPSDWMQGYGYQFWRCRHGAYQASGVFGQGCIILPEQEAVLAFTAGIDVLEVQQLLDIVWEELLPAFGRPDEVSASEDALDKKLSGLNLAPVSGEAAPEIPAHSIARTFEVDANERHIEMIVLNFSQDDCEVIFKTPHGEDTFLCSQGEWRVGQMSLLNTHWQSGEPARIAASGAWISEDSFTMTVRLLETPFFYTLGFHFIGDELLIEMRINVTMETRKTLTLTAHPLRG